VPGRKDIAATLRSRITGGEYPVGSKLPSTREITAELGGSRTTTSAALHLLADEGLLTLKDKSTAVVRPPAGTGAAAPEARGAATEESWHEAALEAWHTWDRFSNARTPVEAADAIVAMNNAMSMVATFLPGYDYRTGTIVHPDDEPDDQVAVLERRRDRHEGSGRCC
jgi:DNA-binding FadR family transcriptional regulator